MGSNRVARSPLFHDIIYKFQHVHFLNFLFYWLTVLKITLYTLKNELFPTPPTIFFFFSFFPFNVMKVILCIWCRNGNGLGLGWKKLFQTQTLKIFYIPNLYQALLNFRNSIPNPSYLYLKSPNPFAYLTICKANE